METYGIEPNPNTVKNQRCDKILQRMHLNILDILRTSHYTRLNCQGGNINVLQDFYCYMRITVYITNGYFPR